MPPRRWLMLSLCPRHAERKSCETKVLAGVFGEGLKNLETSEGLRGLKTNHAAGLEAWFVNNIQKQLRHGARPGRCSQRNAR